MKFITVLATLAAATSALVVQVNIKDSERVSPNLRFPIRPLKHEDCLPLDYRCEEDEDCCSDHCFYLSPTVAVCAPPPEHDEPPCLPNGSECYENEDCCSGFCDDGQLVKYCWAK